MPNGLNRQRAEIPVGEGPKCRFADSDDGNWSHIDLRIAPMPRPSCTFAPQLRLVFRDGCIAARTLSQQPFRPVSGFANGGNYGAARVRVNDPTRRLSEAPADASGDAQTRFIQDNLRRVFLLIYRIVGNVDDAQDLTQETFIKALQRQSQLKDLDKAGHWLSRIASNTAIDHLRRNRKISFSDVGDLPESVVVSHGESPEQIVLRGERKLHLDGGLGHADRT